MAKYKFEGFVFDAEKYKLTRRRERVALRPKALQLLRLLLENQERVVSKSEILTSLWGSAYARDHLLFQLVSELRRSPFAGSFVRTVPNQGYQWNVVTRVVQSGSVQSMRIAACTLLGIVCLSAFMIASNKSAERNSYAGLPALSAFTKGVVALEKGSHQQATEWFRFALNENPDSVEVSLFLAESLYQQNKNEESSQHLHALLNKPELGAYSRMTATDLLSRIRQRQGRMRDALHFAKQSQQIDVVGQCSIDAVEQRVDMLARELGADGASSSLASEDNSSIAELPHQKNYNDKCEQLEQEEQGTSYCKPSDMEDAMVNDYLLEPILFEHVLIS